MKLAPLFLSAAVFLCVPAWAQTPATGGDQSVTATCKDGTTYTGKTMRGACRGHGGVDKGAKAAPAAAAEPAAKAKKEKAAAPAGESVSAVCKDGTTYTGKSMRGACRGHGGVDKSKSAASGSSAAPAAAAPAAAAASAVAAPGGGAGKVWVNTESKVYHCSGDRFYGKTKKGEYMSEAQAKAQGFRASHDKACNAG